MAPAPTTILLVDDDEMIRQIGARILERLGYEALQAAGGQEAVASLEKNRERVALVIFDLVMPGMNSEELLGRMKSIVPQARFLLASGYGRDEKVNRLLSLGCDGFIQKPFRIAELDQLIQSFLKERPPAA